MTYLMLVMAIAMLSLFTIKPRPKVSLVEGLLLTAGYVMLFLYL